MGLEMVRLLELELKTYDRERTRLEDEHRGKFVLIRGEDIVAVVDDFRTASEHAARWFKEESYLIHRIGTEMTDALVLLDGLAAIYTHARKQQRSVCPTNAHSRRRPRDAG